MIKRQWMMTDDSKMTSFERAVYAAAYSDTERIRGSNAWYQTFTRDMEDAKGYQPLGMPVLGIATSVIII